MGMPVINPSGVLRCQAITDIIESVALEQAALAHILNAEGEKIQAIVANSTPEFMLEANKSVKNMVTSISKLEMLLQFKLDLFSDCLCEPCPCLVVEDVNVEEVSPNADIQVTKNSKESFTIANLGFRGASEFQIIPTPTVPITLKSADTGVTLDGDILTIDWTVTQDGTVVLTVGTGECAIDVTIEYSVV